MDRVRTDLEPLETEAVAVAVAEEAEAEAEAVALEADKAEEGIQEAAAGDKCRVISVEATMECDIVRNCPTPKDQ
ncbi:MAG: hypothetical protein Aurels2KO_57170 [Aureliella sp.]